MSMVFEGRMVPELRHELAALRGHWFWYVLLGIALIVLGMIALGSVVVASLAVAVVLGVLLVVAGAAESLALVPGLERVLPAPALGRVVGRHRAALPPAPVGALAGLTLLMASFLMVEGIFKIVSALSYRFASWGWPLLSGVIDLILGVLIWQEWPASAFWVIGLFLGINLIFRGFDWIGLGLALRSLPRPAAA